ncbi:MAG: sugar phosphate nucleotidyltransferase [Bacteroidota bacterium]
MKPTLMVLAAGMGSRYGGLKQLDGLGPAEETIMDYSVYDAIRAGFGKVVFIIRESFAREFEERVTQKFADRIEVVFVYQEVNTPVPGVDQLPERSKPWGTAHAVLVAAEVVQEPFAVVNADDYYGVSSLHIMGDFLASKAAPDHAAMVGFELTKTLSDNGSVSRGVCATNADHLLETVVERHKIERIDGQISFEEEGQKVALPEDSLVSMNLWGFHPSIFEFIRSHFVDFVRANYQNPKAEFYIPLVVNNLMERGQLRVSVLPSEEKWYGVTYREDKDGVQQALRHLHDSGIYPNPLWH